MIQSAANNQYKLLNIINELFTYVIDPYSGKRVIRINPKLTEDTLQKSVEKTRKYIVNLYIKCETDYVEGVKLFEAIVESKIIETTEKQIELLKNEANKIIKETKKASQPVIPPPPEIPTPVIPPAEIPTPVINTQDTSPSITSPPITSSVKPIPINTLTNI
jgi:hypothetical protein